MPRKSDRSRTYPEVGRAIREARLAKGWSQDDLARVSGVSRRQVVLMEAGGNSTLDYLERVFQQLGLAEVAIGRTLLRVSEPLRGEQLRRDSVRLAESIAALLTLAEVLPDTRSGEKSAREHAIATSATPDERAPVRIYLVENDWENVDWRNRMIDFASRSDELGWREGKHTPAKYHSPLHGNVAAGHGAELQPVDMEDLRQIPDHYWEQLGARFALRVYGSSLMYRGIFERDLVYVRPIEGEEPKKDSIVIAELDDKLVCKIWRRVDGKPMLFSASPSHPDPIDPSKFAHFAVKGVVVGRSGYALEVDVA